MIPLTDFSVFDYRQQPPTSDTNRDLERLLERISLAIRELQAGATRALPPGYRLTIDEETGNVYLLDVVGKRRQLVTNNWESTE